MKLQLCSALALALALVATFSATAAGNAPAPDPSGSRVLTLGRSVDGRPINAIENGDFGEASRLSHDSRDPVLRMIWHGLNHVHYSLQGALQVAAGMELRKAGRFLTVMDTLVTLAPLLGLLGTVTGIMGSFNAIGNDELAVSKVTGGIGEALIATACGLGIAIISLIPYNYFTGKTSKLQFELETAATNIEVMVQGAKQRGGFDTMEIRRAANEAESQRITSR